MKAYVLHSNGKISYEETERPVLNPGWALVKVKAVGICSSDIPRIFSNGAYFYPLIPGHEVSGIVEEVYDKKDQSWIGKRVGVFPLIPCRKCSSCETGRYELCKNYDYIGSRRAGGLAEYVAVPVWNLLELDSRISDETAALLEPTAVALHAVKRAGIKEGDRVCVVGTGVIGFLTAQWARLYHAESVWIQGRTMKKSRIADACGLNYRIEHNTMEGKPETFHVVFDAVGSNDSLRQSIHLAESGGTIVLIGNPADNMCLEKNLYWKILRQQLTLIGSWNSSYERGQDCDWTEALRHMADGSLSQDALISHVLGQEELEQGLQIMKEKKQEFCKIIVKF